MTNQIETIWGTLAARDEETAALLSLMQSRVEECGPDTPLELIGLLEAADGNTSGLSSSARALMLDCLHVGLSVLTRPAAVAERADG